MENGSPPALPAKGNAETLGPIAEAYEIAYRDMVADLTRQYENETSKALRDDILAGFPLDEVLRIMGEDGIVSEEEMIAVQAMLNEYLTAKLEGHFEAVGPNLERFYRQAVTV